MFKNPSIQVKRSLKMFKNPSEFFNQGEKSLEIARNPSNSSNIAQQILQILVELLIEV